MRIPGVAIGGLVRHPLIWLLAVAAGGAATAAGCGDSDSPQETSPTYGTGTSTGAAGGGSGGGAPASCATTTIGPTRGSAIAISPDDKTIVAVNRDVGTVTILSVDDYGTTPTMSLKAEIAVGAEPWQVAIDGCGQTAYVALRADQKIVEITGLNGEPAKGREVAAGSEPTGLALTPNNRKLYVANWVDGTVSVVDTARMAATTAVDLNPVLAGSGLLGETVSASKSRPALAHPRSIAITNDGDTEDDDEKVYVTEYFAQRIAPEGANGADADTSKKGLLYAIRTADHAVKTIDLSPLADTGFKDSKGQTTGCFPNQIQSIGLNAGFAYVNTVCASPEGPLGIVQKGACTNNAQCTAANATCDTAVGSCTGTCTQESDCGFGSPAGSCVLPSSACKPIPTNVKTTTHPVLYVVDTATDTQKVEATANLNQRWNDLYTSAGTPNDASRRMPLMANDTAFVPDSGVAYVSANGADAIFRVKYDAASLIEEIGAGEGKNFINLSGSALSDEQKGKNPIGIAVAHSGKVAFVANDVTRNVSAIDLPQQIVAGSDTGKASVATIAAQPADAEGKSRLRGKRFFNTGLGRWSLLGQGWGACQSCHVDGLTDNVTWYFARGPRQSTSLDGSFASGDPTDQRIFNWTAIFDEMHDFELNTRGVSGGVGALVSADPSPDPPTNADRINLADASKFPPAGSSGLNGSAEGVTNTQSVLKDWNDITAWTKTIRSPRAPTNLDAKLVAEGESIFNDLMTGGRCQGCHGGAKWTISRRFFAPSGPADEVLLTSVWSPPAGFPSALIPAEAGNQFMRFKGANAAAFDQIQCILRPVGTFGVSPAAVGIVELRGDMVTPAQGAEANGNGYNPPSLLGLSTGAPYFHAGNARTLEELLSNDFATHWKALTQNVNFLAQQGDVDKLTAYLLSIDENKATIGLPNAGAEGGDFCYSSQ